ncbi:MAG: hypothetical protein WBF76_07555 [Pseudonocardiaceae bacterium]
MRLGIGLGPVDLLVHVGGPFREDAVPIGDRLLDSRLGDFLRVGDRLRGRAMDFFQFGVGQFGGVLVSRQVGGVLGPRPVQLGECFLGGVIGLGLGRERGQGLPTGSGGLLRGGLRGLRLGNDEQDSGGDSKHDGLLSRPAMRWAGQCASVQLRSTCHTRT